MKIPLIALLTALCLHAAPIRAQSASCLVLGEKTARVWTSDGERSPVFVAKHCAELKLVSGKAQVSWVARDGKPQVLPVTPQGVSKTPAAGAEERSVNTVWAELTTRRERQQPAYMRNFGGDHLPKVYVANLGIRLASQSDSDATLRIFRLEDGVAMPVVEAGVPSGSPIVVARHMLQPGQAYLLQVQRGAVQEEWRWRTLTAPESAQIDEHIADIDRLVEDGEQRLMLQAMLFEQLKMRTNMDLLIQRLRSH